MNRGRRRSTLWFLDASADLSGYPESRPVAVVPHLETVAQKGTQHMPSYTTETPTAKTGAPPRPPRPVNVDERLIDQARELMPARREDYLLIVDDQAGLVVVTKPDTALIYVFDDRPDAYGQHGRLWVDRPGRVVPRGMNVWQPRPEDAALRDMVLAFNPMSPWSLRDLDAEAAKVILPPHASLQWVGNDPIRARALWKRLALSGDQPLTYVATNTVLGAQLYRVVVDSGWLSSAAVEQL